MDRPRTRGECRDGPRPCPWRGCRYHLWLDVGPCSSAAGGHGRGSIREWDHPEDGDSCALDVAERGGCTLQECADLWCVSRQRIEQIERVALEQCRRTCERLGITGEDVSDRREHPLATAQMYGSDYFGLADWLSRQRRQRRKEGHGRGKSRNRLLAEKLAERRSNGER